jgi:hypothetical protein
MYKCGFGRKVSTTFPQQFLLVFTFFHLLRGVYTVALHSILPRTTAPLVFIVHAVQSLLLLGVMGLSVRDTIAEDSIVAYDAFMSTVAETSFLSLDHNDSTITVYEHDGTDEYVIQSGAFAASDLASSYFEQENEIAVEQGLLSNATEVATETANSTELSKRGNPCDRDLTSLGQSNAVAFLDKRASRCYQFCGTIANCIRGGACPHCYAVRQGCLWQKWCR